MYDRVTIYRRSVVVSLLFTLVLCLLFLGPVVRAEPTAPQLPSKFAMSTVLSGLSVPADMAFLPSGDLLIAENGSGNGIDSVANIWLTRDGSRQEQPVVTISTDTSGDGGLQSIIVDPNFEQNHYFYVWYATGKNAIGWTGTSLYRLSRFTFNPLTERSVAGSETLILSGIQRGELHNGGALAFDDAGNLYIGTGDRENFDIAQDLSSLNGKLLRIHPREDGGYTIPKSNPFVGVPEVRDEIYAYGFRNPFRMARRQSDGMLALGDVGRSNWEEINTITPGANYGWPIREGPCPIGQAQPCEPAPDTFTDPAIYYEHPDEPDRGAAITGLTFYQGNAFPNDYHENVFFPDFNQQFIGTAAVHTHTRAAPSAPIHDQLFEYFARDVGNLVDIEYYDGKLYLLDIVRGTVSRLSYHGDIQAPATQLAADPVQGPAPLTVTLSAEKTLAAEGSNLIYYWTFGDGTTPEFTLSPSITHTYETDGSFNPSLQVIDDQARESEPVTEEISVYSGEMAEIQLENLTEPGRTRYHGGDQIAYTAARDAGTTGLDPDTPYSWRIDLHHNQHIHPLVVEEAQESGIFDIPTANHSNSTALWYDFTLTMHALTESGSPVDVTVQRALLPATSTITLTTVPVSTTIKADYVNRSVPYTFDSIVGVEHVVEIPPSIVKATGIYEFGHWDALTAEKTTQRTFVADDQDMVLTGTYEYARPAINTFVPFVSR